MTALETALKAKDIMVPEPVCVTPTTTLREFMRVLDENGISGAPVVDDEEGRVVGVVSQTDLIRRCLQGTLEIAPGALFEELGEQSDEEMELASGSPICVEEVMTEGPVSVTPDTPVEGIGRLMVENRIHRVIVVDAERFPLGIITSLDLLGAYSRSGADGARSPRVASKGRTR